MKYVRLLLISFVLLFGVVTVISLFIPSRVRISKAININAAPAAVDSVIGDMRQWSRWNPFFSELPDSDIKILQGGNAAAQQMEVNGTTVKWLEKKVKEYVAEMSRDKRNPVHNGWQIITYPGSDSLTVQWYMDFHLNWYPWEKFGSLMFERSYSGNMVQGLTNLKSLLEQ